MQGSSQALASLLGSLQAAAPAPQRSEGHGADRPALHAQGRKERRGLGAAVRTKCAAFGKVVDTAHLHGALGGFKRLGLTKFAEDAKAGERGARFACRGRHVEDALSCPGKAPGAGRQRERPAFEVPLGGRDGKPAPQLRGSQQPQQPLA